MKKSGKKYIVLGILILALIVIFSFTLRTPTEPGKYDDFAQCLTDSNTTMYGAYWCPHCANQKALFGKSFKKINYVECDPRGNNAQPELCDSEGIEGFPTWIFPDGSRQSGEVPLRTLAMKSGCELLS